MHACIGVSQRFRAVFYLLWLFVIAVSVHDGGLVVEHRYLIGTYEQNPVGRWLLEADAGDISILLLAKGVGTLIVATSILMMFNRQTRLAWIVCSVLALFQLLLLAYLHWS